MGLQNLETEFICPICFELLIAPVTTCCGHTYCDKCLFESLLKSSQCPLCRTGIRKHSTCRSGVLEELVNQFVEGQSNDIQSSYGKLKEKYVNWTNKRRVNFADVGSKLDVKDTESIWCVGVVKEIIQNNNHAATLLIHYNGWDRIYDEYICINSSRLAPLGCFTDRRGELNRYSKIC